MGIHQFRNRIIKDISPYVEFVDSFCDDPNFSDPHLLMKQEKEESIIDWINRPDRFCLLVKEEGTAQGIFLFLLIPEERYIEMLMGISRSPEAIEEALDYLDSNYKGYNVDFVFNPKWLMFQKALEKRRATFGIEQQRMVYSHKEIKEIVDDIQLYSDQYKEQYMDIHDDSERYWTAEKTIEAKDRFNIFLAIENNKVVGYIDVSNCFKENEPYDLFVIEEYRNRGIGRKLLLKALKENEPNDMMLLVDIDNKSAIKLYESVGFVKKENFNMLTAHWVTD